MFKLVLILALAAMASARPQGVGNGFGHGGYGHGGYAVGYGFTAAGYGPHGGHGAVGKVQVHQTPYNYQFGLQEHGPHYQRYHHQGASTHHGGPVYAAVGGYGHGGY